MTLIIDPDKFDYVLVGGGLQSGLIALAINHHRPASSVLLIERDSRLGGNHTWSFHPGDVPKSSQAWIAPLIRHQWPRYEVRIHGFSRSVGLAYATIPSDHFADVVSDLFETKVGANRRSRESHEDSDFANDSRLRSADRNEEGDVATLAKPTTVVQESARSAGDGVHPVGDWKLLTNTEVINVSGDTVLTACGKTIHGRQVIDCRGPSPERQMFAGCGYQKFFGFEIELDEDWPFGEPIVMDALADQHDGFRFFYTLPFHSRRVLVEDTRFSDSPTISRSECLAQVTKYLRDHGIVEFSIAREESGVLPMPFTSELRPQVGSPLAGGYAGGWFHAATGYSFPMAVAFAEAVASTSPEQAGNAVDALAKQHVWQTKFSRFLNRLLFRLVAPRHRFRIFRRFYRVLSERAIERFYSHRFTAGDAMRIVVGIPPTVVGLRPLRFIRSFFRREFS